MNTQAINGIFSACPPVVLSCPDLRRTLAFYRETWGFQALHHINGVIAIVQRESVIVQLWQRRADRAAERVVCRLLVDCAEHWPRQLESAPGRTPPVLLKKNWGTEWGISDCDGNRLLLVQSAQHAARRKAGL